MLLLISKQNNKGLGGSQLLQDHYVNLVKSITKLIFWFNWCNLITSMISKACTANPKDTKARSLSS